MTKEAPGRDDTDVTLPTPAGSTMDPVIYEIARDRNRGRAPDELHVAYEVEVQRLRRLLETHEGRLAYVSAYATEEPPLLFRLWSGKHNQWWLPNALGYTSDQSAAGLYPWDEAVRFVTQSSMCADPSFVTRMVAATRNPDLVEEPERATSPPSRMGAREQLSALDLAREWVAVDPYYSGQRELSPRELALMHLAMRCIARPELVRSRLRHASRPSEET